MTVLTEADLLELCHQNRVNIDVLTGYDDTGVFQYGVRLRPWKQNARQPIMTTGTGTTIAEALDNATSKAAKDEWQTLDWAGRPWRTGIAVGGTWGADPTGRTTGQGGR